jgi:hypothetical protein
MRREDLVCLSSSGVSYQRLWATAAIVKCAHLIFWHACSAAFCMDRTGSIRISKYVNS